MGRWLHHFAAVKVALVLICFVMLLLFVVACANAVILRELSARHHRRDGRA